MKRSTAPGTRGGRAARNGVASADGNASAIAGGTDAFVCYSRRDRAFVERLREVLVAHGKEPYVDWTGIPSWSPDYEEELFAAIDAADTFLFVLSPDSVRSDHCRRELERAVDQGKRIRPLLLRDVPDEVPDALRRPQWLDFRTSEDFEPRVVALLEALSVDADWVRGHTRIGLRANEWDARGRDASFLLRGSDLRAAETWLSQQGAKEPAPTPLQVEYVLAARRAAARRRWVVLASVGVAIAVALTLAVVAVLQRNAAGAQRDRALSLDLAAAARDHLTSDTGTSLLLSLEAQRASATPQARQIAIRALEEARNSGVSAILRHPTIVDAGLGHPAFVQGVAFVPDGRMLATAADDGLRVWTLPPRTAAVRRLGSVARLTAVAVSRDGRMIATGGADGLVRLWDFGTGAPVGGPLGQRGQELWTVAFSPDGRTVAAGGRDGALRLWDVRTRRLRSVPVRPSPAADEIRAVLFSPDGTLLAAASDKSGVRLMRRDGDVAAAFIVADRYGAIPLYAVAFSAEGRLIAAGGGLSSSPGLVRVWDVRTRKVVDRFTGHTDVVKTVLFTPDGDALVSGGWDNTIRLWNLRTHAPLAPPLRAHSSQVSSLDVSRNGHSLASGSWDGTARLWPLPVQRRAGRPLADRLRDATGLAFASDANLAATAVGGTVRLWNLPGATPRGRLPGREFRTVALSPDGRTAAAAIDDGDVRVWDVHTGKTRGDLRGYYRTVAFSSDGRTLAAAGEMGSVNLWRVSDLHPVGRLPTGADADTWSLSFSRNGSMLAGADFGGVVRLWRVGDRALAGSFRSGSEVVNAVALSPDGETLAVADDNGTTLWDVATRSRHGAALEPSGTDAVAFSPDGRFLATSGASGLATPVWLWDMQTRTLFGSPLSAHTGPISTLAFTGDGRTLAAAGENGVWLWTGLLWRDFADLQHLVCALVVGDLTRAEWTAAAPGLPYHSQCGVDVG